MNNQEIRCFFKTCKVGDIVQLETIVTGSYTVFTKEPDYEGDSYFYGFFKDKMKIFLKIDAIGTNLILFDKIFFQNSLNNINKTFGDFLLDDYKLENNNSNIESVSKPEPDDVRIYAISDANWFLIDMNSKLYQKENLVFDFQFSKQ